jgi:hypothetical protein
MKKWILIVAAVIAVLQFTQAQRGTPLWSESASGQLSSGSQQRAGEAKPDRQSAQVTRERDDQLLQAFRERRRNLQVTGEGVIVRVLADDHEGARHQRFLLRMASGQTVLVAHNVDLAPRLDSLRAGETVAFSGEYEWNERGGVIHWTHKDPAGRHAPGWLRREGRDYQ